MKKILLFVLNFSLVVNIFSCDIGYIEDLQTIEKSHLNLEKIHEKLINLCNIRLDIKDNCKSIKIDLDSPVLIHNIPIIPTLFFIATGSDTMLKKLMENGANPNLEIYRSNFKSTLIIECIFRKNVKALKILLDNGAKVNVEKESLICEEAAYLSPLICAICHFSAIGDEAFIDIIKLLLEKGADPFLSVTKISSDQSSDIFTTKKCNCFGKCLYSSAFEYVKLINIRKIEDIFNDHRINNKRSSILVSLNGQLVSLSNLYKDKEEVSKFNIESDSESEDKKIYKDYNLQEKVDEVLEGLRNFDEYDHKVFKRSKFKYNLNKKRLYKKF